MLNDIATFKESGGLVSLRDRRTGDRAAGAIFPVRVRNPVFLVPAWALGPRTEAALFQAKPYTAQISRQATQAASLPQSPSLPEARFASSLRIAFFAGR